MKGLRNQLFYGKAIVAYYLRSYMVIFKTYFATFSSPGELRTREVEI